MTPFTLTKQDREELDVIIESFRKIKERFLEITVLILDRHNANWRDLPGVEKVRYFDQGFDAVSEYVRGKNISDGTLKHYRQDAKVQFVGGIPSEFAGKMTWHDAVEAKSRATNAMKSKPGLTFDKAIEAASKTVIKDKTDQKKASTARTIKRVIEETADPIVPTVAIMDENEESDFLTDIQRLKTQWNSDQMRETYSGVPGDVFAAFVANISNSVDAAILALKPATTTKAKTKKV